MDVQVFKEAMAQWSSGVSVITTRLRGQHYGMTASSFSSLSISPFLMMVAVGKNLSTHNILLEAGFFAANILNVNQVDYGMRFAGLVPELEDRFAGVPFTTALTGAAILPEVLAWIDCRLYTTYDGGDHTIFVGEIVACEGLGGSAPLSYYNRTWGTFAPLPPRFRHVVMFRLKERTAEHIALMRAGLESLRASIPVVRTLEIGINVVESARAYDMALTVGLDSLEDLQVYQEHPAHVQVVAEVIRPLVESSVASDYWV